LDELLDEPGERVVAADGGRHEPADPGTVARILRDL
jgi:hypothetical protein